MTMNRGRLLGICTVVAGLLAVAGATCWLRDKGVPQTWTAVDRQPRLWPDYANITIPPNIAPLNFAIQEPGIAYRVRLRGTAGEPIDIASATPSITIPSPAWRRLLTHNRGCRLAMDVYVQRSAGAWIRFAAIENTVARERIDSHLVYRLLGAVYVNWGRMGIYQRDLETYEERPILRNTSFENGCVNCHAFAAGQPEALSLHVRPPGDKPFAGGMIVARGGQASRLGASSTELPALPTYTSWHPTAPWAAVSLTRSEQFMHGAGSETREVYDRHSDIALINTVTGSASPVPALSDPDRLETFPNWSADGRYLYFCSAPSRPVDPSLPHFVGCDTVRYDLMRIAHDVESGTWGTIEPVLTAAQSGRSISEPRASPDGRFLLFCMTSHGAFPVLHSDCDLYLMDLTCSGEFPYRPLTDANSLRADSWHSWSSNSRWIVFSSKRDNGLLARPYLCHIDERGMEHKPFVLPQRDPLFYDTYLKTFNVPELSCGPVLVNEKRLVQAILSRPHRDVGEPTQAEVAAPN